MTEANLAEIKVENLKRYLIIMTIIGIIIWLFLMLLIGYSEILSPLKLVLGFLPIIFIANAWISFRAKQYRSAKLSILVPVVELLVILILAKMGL